MNEYLKSALEVPPLLLEAGKALVAATVDKIDTTLANALNNIDDD